MEYSVKQVNNYIEFEITSLTEEDIVKIPYVSDDMFFHLKGGNSVSFGTLGCGILDCYIDESNTIHLISPYYENSTDRRVLIEKIDKAVQDFLNYKGEVNGN